MTHYIDIRTGARPYGGMSTLCGKHESARHRVAFQFVPRGHSVTCESCIQARCVEVQEEAAPR
jgi:hypothetical protein